jgi:hypothetical protein
MGAGVETIDDPAQLRAVRGQARRVHLKAALTAVLMTALYLAVS